MRTTLKVVVLIAVGVAISRCGGTSTPTSPSASPGPTGSSTALTITITRQNGEQSFVPNPADVGGQMVVFRNADTVVHRVVLNDGSLDTGNIAPNATTAAILMPASGTNYHCSLHPDMIGAVNASGGGPAPPCQGPYCG